MTKSKPKLFLIDVSSFIFRAYFGIKKLSTSKGLPTNAIYGFTTMLLGLLEKQKPDYIACVFDTPAPTFRKKMYPDYKANRGAPPEDLLPQFPYIEKLVDAFEIQKLIQPGLEADDLIATLAKCFSECEVVIVSGDKDLMQLVNDRICILDTMKEITYDENGVKEKLGVSPQYVTDFLGLTGDSSDNIPGVPGIGPKTAIELIETYGSIEDILKAIPQMPEGKKRNLLESHAQSALLSKKLATVSVDLQDANSPACKKIELSHLKTPHIFSDNLKLLLYELEFNSLVKRCFGDQALQDLKPTDTIAVGNELPQTKLIQDESSWQKLLEKFSHSPVIVFDTETRGKKITELEIVGLSLCVDESDIYYVPLRHKGENQLPVKQVLVDFKKISTGKTLVAHNLKYDYSVFLAGGVQLSAQYFDTMLAHYLLEPEEKHGLDVLSRRYLNTEIGDFEKTLDGKIDFSEVPLEKAAQYSGLDAWSTYKLYEHFKEDLKRESLENIFDKIEMPIVPILAHMEWNGVFVDIEILSTLSAEYSQELEKIEKEIFKTVGYTFNLNSPKQLSQVLFEKLNLPVIQKTKTGYSTDVFVLEKLAPMHPVPKLIHSYREFTKLKNTYVDVLPTLIEKDGRVHASFNQAVAATGRLSGSNPNLQNIPIKTESGRKIRKAFSAAPGHLLVGADYSQIELRVVAALSQDPALIKAFEKGEDVHRATACEVFNVEPSHVTESQRAAAKAINFGLIYGKTAFGLSQELNISRAEAQKYIDTYFTRYVGVKRFMENCLKEAHQTHFAKTFFGRKRQIKDLDNKNAAVRNSAERIAMNTPVQGTAADLMKRAMIKVEKACEKFGAKLILQVHDELVLEVPQENAEKVKDELKIQMEHIPEFKIPFQVSCGIAKNWMDL